MIRSTYVTAALAAIAVPAAAQPPGDAGQAPTALVRYDDLNLATAAGRIALDGRVRDAATKLCADDEQRDLGRTMLADACFRTALESAHVQISSLSAPAAAVRIAARAPILAGSRR